MLWRPILLRRLKRKAYSFRYNLQILRRDVVIDASNPVLFQAPEASNRVRVSIARDVHACRVIDAPMSVSHVRQRIVIRGFIRENHRFWQDMLANMRQQIARFGWTWNDFSHDTPATFDHAESNRLIVSTGASSAFAQMLVSVLSAIKAFIDFNLARELWSIIFFEHRAN